MKTNEKSSSINDSDVKYFDTARVELIQEIRTSLDKKSNSKSSIIRVHSSGYYPKSVVDSVTNHYKYQGFDVVGVKTRFGSRFVFRNVDAQPEASSCVKAGDNIQSDQTVPVAKQTREHYYFH